MGLHGAFDLHSKRSYLAIIDAPTVQDLLIGEVIGATRFEAARTVDDFLARRTRCLLLNARAAREMTPKVAPVMTKELGHHQNWVEEQVEEFLRISALCLPD